MGDAELPAAARLGDASRSDGQVGRSVTASPNVLINRRPALRQGDQGVHRRGQAGAEWEAIAGAPRVLINGRRAQRIGDVIGETSGSAQGELVEGSPDVLIGDYVAGERTEPFAATWVLTDMPGPAGVPLLHTPWKLLLDGRVMEEGETDASGKARMKTKLAPNRSYELRYPGRSVEIVTGEAASIETVKGQALRLAFLGYHPGPVTGRSTPKLAAALTEFQIDAGLEPTGACSPETKSKLAEKAGW
jgi:uncharacterized Zn-binding protein involved in type VI secretion